jgi:hypothetical protein
MLGSGNSKGDGPYFCITCGKEGHSSHQCPTGDKGSYFCGYCGACGHAKHQCPKITCRKCGKSGHFQDRCRTAVASAKKADKLDNAALIAKSVSESQAELSGTIDALNDVKVEITDLKKQLKKEKENKLRKTHSVKPDDFVVYDVISAPFPVESYLSPIMPVLLLLLLVALLSGEGGWFFAVLTVYTYYFGVQLCILYAYTQTVPERKVPKYDVMYGLERPIGPDDFRADSISVADLRHEDPKLCDLIVTTWSPRHSMFYNFFFNLSYKVQVFMWVNSLHWIYVHFTKQDEKCTRKVVSLELMSQIMTGMGTDPLLSLKDLTKRLQLYASTTQTVNLSRYNVLHLEYVVNDSLEVCLLMIQKQRLEKQLFSGFLFAPVTML